jgi:putative transposase
MSSYRQLLYHIVFRTMESRPTIRPDHSDPLFAYITGIIKNKHSHLYRINGVANHIHLLTDIHPSIALADFLRDVKASSSLWMKESGLFPDFNGWAAGYGAFSCSYLSLDKLIEYIKDQQVHHKIISFEEEYRRIVKESGIEIDEKYFP